MEAFNCRGRLVHAVAACKDTLVGELLQLIAIITVIIKIFRHGEDFFSFSSFFLDVALECQKPNGQNDL